MATNVGHWLLSFFALAKGKGVETKWQYVGSLCAFIVLVGVTATRVPATWPPWRGPAGNGSSDSTNLPTEWSLEKNIKWRTQLPSWSGGTPIVWGDRVFVTSPSKAEQRTEASTESTDEARDGDRGGRRGFGGGRG